MANMTVVHSGAGGKIGCAVVNVWKIEENGKSRYSAVRWGSNRDVEDDDIDMVKEMIRGEGVALRDEEMVAIEECDTPK